MTDLAALGIAVDSRPVAAGAKDLDQLVVSAKKAEAATRGLEQGFSKAGTATQAATQSMMRMLRSADEINKWAGVRSNFGGAERADDIAAYGSELDRLRAKYNPLFALEQAHLKTMAEINQAAKVGAISEAERVQAISRSQVAYQNSTRAMQTAEKAIQGTGRAAALSSFQMTNLAFQLNDVATMAALGADPMRILASQAGQFYQILATGEGGIRGSLGYLKDTLVGMVTPMRLVVTGIGSIVTATVAAGNSWYNAQNQINLALMGAGSAAGVTARQINDIADAAAASGNITVGAARDMALALASTGRVSVEIIDRAVGVGRNLSRVYGEDVVEATTRLSRALADPAKGVDDLNRRLAAFDDGTARHIKNLVEQGRLYEAQQILISGVERATASAARATSIWEAGWNGIASAASRAWAAMSKEAGAVVGIGEVSELLARANDELVRMMILRDQIASPLGRRNQDIAIAAKAKEVQELGDQLRRDQKAREDARIVTQSGQLGDIIRGLSNESSMYDRLIAQRQKLNDLASDPTVVARLDPTDRAALETAKKIADLRVWGHRTSMQLAIEEHDLSVQEITARTAAQKGELAYRRELLRLQIAGDPDADAKAALARQRALLDANYQISEQQKQQLLSQQQRVEVAALELSLIGKTAGEQERARAVMEVRQRLESEAMQNYGSRDAYDKAHLASLLAQVSVEQSIREVLRQQQLIRDAQFERDQMGRTRSEQDVYSRLRSAGLLTNDEIQTASAQAAAAQLRLNDVIRQTADASREFGSGFIRDMVAGKSATESLTNALQRLADKLVDIGMDNLMSALLGKQAGNGVGLLSSLLGPMLGTGMGPLGATGAATGAAAVAFPIMHSGGIVGNDNHPMRAVPWSVFDGAKRYHRGSRGVGLASDEVPAILQRGEVVLPRGSGSGGGGSNVQINITAPPGTEVQQSERQDGDLRIVDLVLSTVERGVGSGRLDRVMGSRFGAAPAVRRR